MDSKTLIDTNIIIYFLKDEIPGDVSEIFNNSFAVSVISKIEFLGWKGFDDITFLQAKEFIDNVEIIGLNDQIIEKTITLKREIKVKTPDAVIAATCLVENRKLVTRNSKDFEKIPDLKIFNPFS